MNWINGRKDDGCLADYPHYPSLCCSTRRVDLADFIFSSCKDANMAWRDGQSAKVWNTRVGRGVITQQILYQLWHGAQSVKTEKSIFECCCRRADRWCRSCHLGPYNILPIKIRLTSAWQSRTLCLLAIHSITVPDDCFPAVFPKGPGIKDSWYTPRPYYYRKCNLGKCIRPYDFTLGRFPYCWLRAIYCNMIQRYILTAAFRLEGNSVTLY